MRKRNILGAVQLHEGIFISNEGADFARNERIPICKLVLIS